MQQTDAMNRGMILLIAWLFAWLAYPAVGVNWRCTTPLAKLDYPQAKKVVGIHYARSAQGRELAIIDYRHPLFARTEPTHLQIASSVLMLQALGLLPSEALELIGRHSEILANFVGSPDTKKDHLSGPATYLAKLGPQVYHPKFLDRLASGSVQSIEASRRGAAVAALETSAIESVLSGNPDAKSITILNIGGGPAFDSLNALMVLQPRLEETGTAVHIEVLDSDADGATLGKNSLKALKASGAPLAKVRADLTNHEFNWNQPKRTRGIIEKTEGPVVVAAEGSLFEYGSDEAIRQNLRILHESTPSDTLIVGSAFLAMSDNPSPVVRAMMKVSPQMGWKLRGMGGGNGLCGIQALAAQTGWEVVETRKNSIYVTFSLRKRSPR